jgi:acyl-CoA thioester hydrolase
MTDTEYAYETDVPVRYRDLDTMGWTHNTVLLVYVEEARIGYFRDVLGADADETDGAIVRQEIEYRTPVEYGESVTVRFRVAAVGESSLTTRFEVTADGTVAVEGEVVYVFVDESRTPRAVPQEWKEEVLEFEPATVESD